MYRIVIKKQARKGLLKLPGKVADSFRLAFKALAIDTESSNYDVKKLSGRDGFRLRIGRYRAIYSIDDGLLVIMVINVGSPGDIYK